MKRTALCLALLFVFVHPAHAACSGRHVTMHGARIEIHTALRSFARQTRIELFLHRSVHGTVRADLDCALPDVALRTLVEQVGASYCIEKGSIRIFPKGSSRCGRAQPARLFERIRP